MKGIQGLILGLGVGLAAALFNWAYMTRATGDIEAVAFVGIAPNKDLDIGHVLAEEDLVPVAIPPLPARRLKDFAYLYADRASIIGLRVTRPVPGGSLLLQDDLRPPPPRLRFGGQPAGNTEEIAMFIPIDTRTIVPSLIEPGDMVSFIVSAPTPVPGGNPPAGENPTAPATNAGGGPQVIGKFKVLAVGNRLTSVEAHRAYQLPQSQENILTISVKLEDGRLEPKAERLWKMLEATNFRQVGVILHSRDTSQN
ncbi:hypothetical protein [Thermogutta sp.]|uniref:hypothetical protein n=1 Tax=Thermogutta sp. TaxID=1962930 RepID=UPI0032206F00